MRAYDALTAAEKLQLLLLTSNVRTEFMKAAAIQHRILCTALRGAAMAAFHKERKLWVREVQYNVSHHMGWLNKALDRMILVKVKTRGSGVNLGEMNARYRIMPLTPRIAAKYRDMAVLTTALGLMQIPKSFREYQDNCQELMKKPKKYHDLWHVRMFFELERFAAGVEDMLVSPGATVPEFVQVFPDSVGYMTKLAKYYLLAQTPLPPAPRWCW